MYNVLWVENEYLIKYKITDTTTVRYNTIEHNIIVAAMSAQEAWSMVSKNIHEPKLVDIKKI
jgi:hypothetical protein